MFKKLTLVLSSALLLGGCSLSLDFLKPAGKSGLQVTSTPQSTVFLDGNSLGTTPLQQQDLKPGKHTIKLVATDNAIAPWETSVTLTSGVLTVIDRQLSSQPSASNGYTLSFEKLSQKNKVELAITTIPDSVTVSVDNNPQGFTPLSLDTLAAGDHTVVMSSPGFTSKTIRARAVDGYRLTIAAQLAAEAAPTSTPTPLATPSATPTTRPTPRVSLSPTPTATSAAVPKPYVEVLSTPTGWLRVRSSAGGEEVGKAYPGNRFPYLGTESGGYKIQYQATQGGWVSNTYSKLVQ